MEIDIAHDGAGTARFGGGSMVMGDHLNRMSNATETDAKLANGAAAIRTPNS